MNVLKSETAGKKRGRVGWSMRGSDGIGGEIKRQDGKGNRGMGRGKEKG